MTRNPVSVALLGAIVASATVSCGGDDTPPVTESSTAALRGVTRVVVDGEVRSSSPTTCSLPECSICPGPSFADVVVVKTATVAVVCFPQQVGQVLQPTGGNLNINAGTSSIAIDLSQLPGHRLLGDININSVGQASIYGSTSTPTVVSGNVNLHAGDVRVFNLIVEGDVSINRNDTTSALVDTTIRGNLNVHVTNFVGIRSDVFGDLNINRDRSVISSMGFGQNRNVHGTPAACHDLRAFSDTNGDGIIELSERFGADQCPASNLPVMGPIRLETRFDSSGLDVAIRGGSGTFDFGMAETGALLQGWFGEACTPSALCHRGVGSSFRLTTVQTSASVVPGQTTLFDNFSSGGITYVIFDQGQCYTTGNNPSFYPGCQGI